MLFRRVIGNGGLSEFSSDRETQSGDFFFYSVVYYKYVASTEYRVGEPFDVGQVIGGQKRKVFSFLFFFS